VARVTFVGDDGHERTVDASLRVSVMSTAVREGVHGIVGECGGNVSCGTCHVWVRPEFYAAVGDPGDMEEDLLDMGTSDRRSTSRLSCQIQMSEELDGLILDVPPEQP
jgi:ferredoxin, 2Fe-2S